MGHFPMCINLENATVLLVGGGKQIQEKKERLTPFGCAFHEVDSFSKEALSCNPVIVIVGDKKEEEAKAISEICKEEKIPVNVVDLPKLCTFFFPALITKGDLTVAISSGGKNPAVSSYMRKRIEEIIPKDMEEKLEWISNNRQELKEHGILKETIKKIFE